MVVKDLEQATETLKNLADKPLKKIYHATVDPFSVNLVRFSYGDQLIEFVSPFDEGFFSRCLGNTGEALHHIGFNIPDIDGAVGKLTDSQFNQVTDGKASGPKGKVSFLTTDELSPVHLELCQLYSEQGY